MRKRLLMRWKRRGECRFSRETYKRLHVRRENPEPISSSPPGGESDG